MSSTTNFNRYEYKLLSVCQLLHEYHTGIGDADLDELKAYVDWLEYRLNDWRQSSDSSEQFDYLVRELAELALLEGKDCLKRGY